MYTLPEYQDELISFTENYVVERILSASSNVILLPTSERKCRFCNRIFLQTSFNKEAHLIPRFLGSVSLLSDFECDECNSYFSGLESNFANSMGIARTLWALTNPNNNTPGFQSQEVKAKREDFYGVDSVSIASDPAIEAIKIDKKKGTVEIDYSKRTYTPLNVYKLLLKMALSTIGNEYVEKYQYAIKFLMTSKLDSLITSSAKIFVSQSPHGVRVNEPVCIIFKKKEPGSRLLTHIFMFCVENLTYQFPLLFNIDDREMGLYNNTINPHSCPPIFNNPPDVNMRCNRRIWDLSSTEKTKGENEYISFNFNPSDIEGAILINPITGRIGKKSSEADTISKFYIANEGQRADFPFLSNGSMDV